MATWDIEYTEHIVKEIDGETFEKNVTRKFPFSIDLMGCTLKPLNEDECEIIPKTPLKALEDKIGGKCYITQSIKERDDRIREIWPILRMVKDDDKDFNEDFELSIEEYDYLVGLIKKAYPDCNCLYYKDYRWYTIAEYLFDERILGKLDWQSYEIITKKFVKQYNLEVKITGAWGFNMTDVEEYAIKTIETLVKESL